MSHVFITDVISVPTWGSNRKLRNASIERFVKNHLCVGGLKFVDWTPSDQRVFITLRQWLFEEESPSQSACAVRCTTGVILLFVWDTCTKVEHPHWMRGV